MALLLPILLYLTFGVIEYGWMFLKQQQITNAARQGARLGATPTATQADVQARINELLGPSPGANITGYTTTITGFDSTPGDPLTVAISVNYRGTDNSIMNLASLIPVPASLSARVVMAKEGP